VRKRNLPDIKAPNPTAATIHGFGGMDGSTHPTLLKDNILSNAQNTFIRDGILEKRGGSVIEGDVLSSEHVEEFTATTKKDTPTTAEWTTDGAANNFSNSATVLSGGKKRWVNGYSNRQTVVSSTGIIVSFFADGSYKLSAKKSSDNGVTWTKLDGTAGTTQIDADTTGQQSAWISDDDSIYLVYNQDIGGGDDSARFRKLSYSAGSWTVGTEYTVWPTGGGYNSTKALSITYDETNNRIWVSASLIFYISSVYVSFIYAHYSDDEGANWTDTIVNVIENSGTTNSYPTAEIIMGADGKPMILYSAYIVSTGKYNYYSQSLQSGSTWYNKVLLKADCGTTQIATLCLAGSTVVAAIADTGKVSLYYYSSSWSFIKDAYTLGTNEGCNFSISTDGTNTWLVYFVYNSSTYVGKIYFTTSASVTSADSWTSQSQILTFDDSTSISAVIATPTNIKAGLFPIGYERVTSTDTVNRYGVTVQLSGILQSVGYDSAAGSQTYTSTNSMTLSTGGVATVQFADSADNTTFGDFSSDITTMNKRYIKFKITLTTTNLATAPSVDNIKIQYGGALITGAHTFTNNAGSKYFLIVSGTNLYVRESGTTWLNIKSNLTTSLVTSATAFQNFLIITNGTDAPIRFNGKTTTGTLTVSNGSGSVTGSSTKWNTASDANQLSVGGRIKIQGDSTWYTISAISSDTALTITPVKTGTASAGSTYEAYGAPVLAGTPPSGKYVVVHKNFVFFTGMSATPTRLQYSAAGDATSWPAANIIDVNTNDGEINTGLLPYKDVLLIGKYDSSGIKKSVNALYGSGASDFTLKMMTSDYGFVGHQATCTTPNEAIFLDRSGVVKTNGVSFQKIGQELENITSTMNQAYVQKAVCQYFNEHVFIGVPIGSSTYNNYLLDLDLEVGGWTYHTGINPGYFAIYSTSTTPELYFADQSTLPAVFKFNSGTSDNSQAIDWIIDTKELDFKTYFIKKRFKYLYAFFEPTGDYDVDAYYSVDGSSTWTQLTDAVEVSGTDDVFKRWILPGLSGSSIKFRLRNNTSTDSIKLAKITCVAIKKRYRSA